jgi:hypothetical protein
MRPGEALGIEPRRLREDVGVTAAWAVGAGAPEPVQQAELDKPAQAALGRPQLAIHEQRCQLRGDDVGTEEPEQEVLLASLAPARMERSESGLGLAPG